MPHTGAARRPAQPCRNRTNLAGAQPLLRPEAKRDPLAMSRSLATPKASSDLLSVSFNQDGSCVSIGTRKGYSIANAEPFGKVYSRDDGPCSIVEMLFCTSLVALVGTADSQPSSSPRKLKIVNTKVSLTLVSILRTLSSTQSGLDEAAIDHLRTRLSDDCAWGQAQSSPARCHPRRGNLHLRHLKHEAPSHY